MQPGKLSQAALASIILVVIPLVSVLITRAFGPSSPNTTTGAYFMPALLWALLGMGLVGIGVWVVRRRDQVNIPRRRK